MVAAKIPDAGFRFSPAAPVPGQTVTFTSTSVASAGSAITKIEWNLDAISGFAQQGSVVTYAFPTAGVHTVEIKVTEDSGGVDIATADIVVNAPPTALMRFSPAQPYTGDVVQFASLSSDPDGYLAAETWDLDGDGQYDDAGGKLASRAFTTVGAHTVRLRVVDGSGAGAVQAVTLNVRARPVAPPPPPEQLDPTVRITSRPGKSSTLITRLGIRAEKGAMVKAGVQGQGLSAPARIQHPLARQGNAPALARAAPAGRHPHPDLRDGEGQDRLLHVAADPALQAPVATGPLPRARDHPRHPVPLMRLGRRALSLPLGLVLALSVASAASAEDFTISPPVANPSQEITVTPLFTPSRRRSISAVGFQFENETAGDGHHGAIRRSPRTHTRPPGSRR